MQMIAAAGLVALLAGQPSSANVQALTKQFMELETTLMGAAKNRQSDAEEAMVSPDFAWSASFYGERNRVMNRAEWMKGGQHYDLNHFQIAMLTAQKFDNNVIVQFRLKAEAGSPAVDLSGEYVITDLWRAKGSSWLLARRWVTRALDKPQPK